MKSNILNKTRVIESSKAAETIESTRILNDEFNFVNLAMEKDVKMLDRGSSAFSDGSSSDEAMGAKRDRHARVRTYSFDP